MAIRTYLLAALSAAALASPSAAADKGFTLEDLQRFARVGEPVMSPDGRWVLYTVSRIDAEADKNVSQLWMSAWDGRETLQLTYGKSSVSHPQWSPDGRFIAFQSDREGEAKGAQVWVLDRRGGEARQLTNVKQSLEDYKWSPDGHRLVLQLIAKDEPDEDKTAKPKPPKPIVLDRYHFKEDIDGYLTSKTPHLYLFDVETKALAKLTDNPETGPGAYGEAAPAWSPDGARIAFVSNQAAPDPDRVANTSVFVTEAKATSKPLKITRFAGRSTGPLAWTRDGARIVFRQGLSPRYSIYDQARLAVAPSGGGETAILAPRLDQWVGPPVLDATSNVLMTIVNEDREAYVAEVSLNPSTGVQRLTRLTGSALGLSAAGGHAAVLWTTDAADPEIYALEDGGLRKITGQNDALLSKILLGSTLDLSAKTPDGVEVHGLLTLPVGYAAGAKAPMLLRIHGGPTSQDAHGFNLERQLFAAKGYAVLNVNYRGSTGRGHAYSETINADWGHKEVIDLLAMVDAAVATGKIDPNALGVGGWSYGGILTDYSIATTPRFKAASSGAGMGNLLGFYGVDEYILQYETELGPPWKNLAPYLKLSYPFLHADHIHTPTLFMGGDKDFNVPIVGGEQMYQALKSLNVPSELIVYPGEFHGFTRPSFIKDRYQRWFYWYDHYVRGLGPARPPEAPAKPASTTPTS